MHDTSEFAREFTRQFDSSGKRSLMSTPELDYAFLKYIGVTIDGEQRFHHFYLPFFEGRQRVLDLGCGLGGFVKLLREEGNDAFGVDSDSQCVAEARAHHIPVIEADVVDYLRDIEPQSLEAIFSAHLVEHLPYSVTLEIIQLAYRALKPGGRLLLVTPNPRALVSHLELYPMHFGHVAMYHPNLLAFFMTHAGFTRVEVGENPDTSTWLIAPQSPLAALQKAKQSSSLAVSDAFQLDKMVPKPRHPLRRLAWHIRKEAIRWIVQPYHNHVIEEIRQVAAQVNQLAGQFSETVQAMDRSFECYAVGDKV